MECEERGLCSALREIERMSRPSADYMDTQPDINGKMRAILVDWLVEVHEAWKLVPEVLFLTVDLLDRFLVATHVQRSDVQLAGIVALLIASKYEEVLPPPICDLAYITDNTYSEDQILQMECRMLYALEFDVAVPTVGTHLARLLRKAGGAGTHASGDGDGDEQVVARVARYVSERALQELHFLKFAPREIAAAAVYLARRVVLANAPAAVWPRVLQRESQYTEGELLRCAQELAALVMEARDSGSAALHAVRKKHFRFKNPAATGRILGAIRSTFAPATPVVACTATSAMYARGTATLRRGDSSRTARLDTLCSPGTPATGAGSSTPRASTADVRAGVRRAIVMVAARVSLRQLPDEILLAILGLVDVCALGRCKVLSKRWRSLASDDSLWHREYQRLRTYKPSAPPDGTSWFAHLMHFVQKLTRFQAECARFVKRGRPAGQGSAGRIWHSIDQLTGQAVTIRRFPRYLRQCDDEGIDVCDLRHIATLRALQRSPHRNIARLMHVAKDTATGQQVSGSTHYFCVYAHQGENLKYEMNQGNVGAHMVLPYAQQMLLALQHLHARGFVHRDIKPWHLIVDAHTRRLVLVGFDIARNLAASLFDDRSRGTRTLTPHDVVTLWYRAPEIMLGGSDYGAGVDVFAAGCVFAEMASATRAVLLPGHCELDQLHRTFRLMGTPTEATWPGVSRYADYRDTFPQWPTGRSLEPHVARAHPSPEHRAHAASLLRDLLALDPGQRLTATDALRHPFFTRAPPLAES